MRYDPPRKGIPHMGNLGWARRVVRALMVVAVAALGMAAPAAAGTFPNLLDRHFGWVIHAPRIHNIFWDAAWNAHNPGALSTAALDSFTSHLATNGYLNPAGQYGVGAPSFGGATVTNGACGLSKAPASVTEVTIAAWFTCELTNPFSGVPSPGGAPAGTPVSNDLYVVYLPSATTITGTITVPRLTVLGHSIGPFTFGPAFCGAPGAVAGGDHWIWPVPKLVGLIPVIVPVQVAFVPAKCAAGKTGVAATDAITNAASHEIAEAVTDAVPDLGFVDDSEPSRFSQGEAGDLCEPGGGLTITPPPAGTPRAASEQLNGLTFATYWSNSQRACVAGPSVGKFRLGHNLTVTRPGTATRLRVTWIAPHRCRDLRTVELPVIDGGLLLGILRFNNDGSKQGKLGLSGHSGKPGAPRTITDGPLSLLL